MPNYCHNRLRAEGADDMLDAFVVAVADGEKKLSFEKIVPLGNGEDAVDAWGTTGGPYCLEVRRSRGEIYYEFESSWAPPAELVAAVAALWPDLIVELTFVDPGSGAFGSRYYAEGSFRHSIGGRSGWSASDDEMRDFLEDEWPELAKKWWDDEAA
jgi:hypothetical protein